MSIVDVSVRTQYFVCIYFAGEFWLGLKKIYSLASQGNSVLHIQLEDWKQNRQFIEYGFYLDGPESNYAIRLIYLSGTLPNPMSNHTGVVFSTTDGDNAGNQASRCPHPQSGKSDLTSVSAWVCNFLTTISFIFRWMVVRLLWRHQP